MAADLLQMMGYLLANVSDAASGYRVSCFSCMSRHLETQYTYISHLYRRPALFGDHCERHMFDASSVPLRNCTDMCVSLRIHDVLGGRRRTSWLRGCLSDVIGYNAALVGSLGGPQCVETTVRELFQPSASRQELDATRISVCGCHDNFCNAAMTHELLLPILLFLLLYAFLHQVFSD